jgi:hypothetical protein
MGIAKKIVWVNEFIMIKKLNIFSSFLYFIFFSCNAQTGTPEQYKNKNNVSPNIYQNISQKILDSVKSRIFKKEDPYYPSENDSLTEVFVDTILFSPSMDKIAFFVITKNSNDKLLDKGDKNDFHFTAYSFLGHLDSIHNITNLLWVSGFSLFNYKSKIATSNRIRDVYFKEITKRTNTKGESTYKYNFDDVRFWSGPVWTKYD